MNPHVPIVPSNRRMHGYRSREWLRTARDNAALFALLAYVLALETPVAAFRWWRRRTHPLRRLQRASERFAKAAEREGRRWAR